MDWKQVYTQILPNTILIVVIVVFSFGSIELALRVRQPAEYIEDELLQLRPRPGLFGRDAQGYKNPQVLETAGFVALGNSLTQGNNAEMMEAWPHVTGRELATSTYNFGVDGYGPVQYQYLIDKAFAMNPSVVSVGFFPGSDLLMAYHVVYNGHGWDRYRDIAFDTSGKKPGEDARERRLSAISGYAPSTFQYKLFAARTWMRENLRVYAMVGDITRQLREQLHIVSNEQETTERINKLAAAEPGVTYNFDRSGIETQLSAKYRFDAVNLSNPATQEGWRIFQKATIEMRDKAASRRVRFVLTLIPTKEFVYLTYLQQTREKIPEGFDLYFEKEKELVKRVKEFCAAQKIECVDTLPPMVQSLASGKRIYSESLNGHPGAPGYELIGKHVAEYLKKTKYENRRNRN